VALDEVDDGVVDRLQPLLLAHVRSGMPLTEVGRLEAAAGLRDDAVSARSSSWVDSENPHGPRLGVRSDVPSPEETAWRAGP
jgi:hypothetical protein